MSVDQKVDAIASKWLSEGVAVNEPLTAASLHLFELVRGLVIPSALRRLLQRANGFGPVATDSDGFRFLPIEEYVRMNEHFLSPRTPGSASSFVFLDYLCWCWGYAVELGEVDNGSVSIVGTSTGDAVRVADSFDEFLELYLSGSDVLYSV